MVQEIQKTRADKIRIIARYLIERGEDRKNGNQARLAEHYKISRQAVSQIFRRVRKALVLESQVADSENQNLKSSEQFLESIEIEVLSKYPEDFCFTSATFGEDLRYFRLSIKLGLKEFGKLLGVAPGAVSNIEYYEERIPWRPAKAAAIIASVRRQRPELEEVLIRLFEKWGYMKEMWTDIDWSDKSQKVSKPATS